MSRYFTSAPPVYARNWTNGQNLVESTKIESYQIVPSKKVHRKKEKKEKKHKKERSLVVKNYPSKKQVSDESELLEKSCVTEEHEQQLHSVGYLSDGSQNSKKRTREVSPAVESHIKASHVAGNPLRIRFVFKKPKEAESLPPQEDRVCSTSGAARPSEPSSSVLGSKSCEQNENLPSPFLESEEIAIPCELKKLKKHKPSKESRYNTLFDGWVPPCVSLEQDDSNDWLFSTRRQGNASFKTSIKKDEDLVMHLPKDSSLPRARFLSEVGIFSLPYTVPL